MAATPTDALGNSLYETRDPRTFAIIGAEFEVHETLGRGFREAGMEAPPAAEFAERQISFQRDVEPPILYKGRQLPTVFRAGFAGYGKAILEIKALPRLPPIEEAQIINYMKATGLVFGLLLGLGPKSLEYRRFINSKSV